MYHLQPKMGSSVMSRQHCRFGETRELDRRTVPQTKPPLTIATLPLLASTCAHHKTYLSITGGTIQSPEPCTGEDVRTTCCQPNHQRKGLTALERQSVHPQPTTLSCNKSDGSRPTTSQSKAVVFQALPRGAFLVGHGSSPCWCGLHHRPLRALGRLRSPWRCNVQKKLNQHKKKNRKGLASSILHSFH